MVDSGPRLAVPRLWIAFTLPIAAAMIIASAAGAFGSAYSRETVSWAAQGVGQDFANLFIVVPLLLAAGFFAAAGSFRALLVWLGLLLYVVYSYVLYAFYVHFNALFLVYVATLGLSFYALAGSLLTIDWPRVTSAFARETHARGMGFLLMLVGVLFAMLWLSEIVPALARGVPPPAAADVGLPVNPIHVLDLAFALPAVIVTAVLVWRRNAFGLLFAVPCAAFLMTMGIAILAMAWTMRARGVAAGGFPLPVVLTIAACGYEGWRYLADV